MTDKVLLNSGYKEYEVPAFTLYANRFYQKRIKDKKGTKYFIDVYEYEIQDGYDYEFVMCTSKEEKFHVRTLIYRADLMTIEEIEEEIENIWKRCEFDYYEVGEENE